MNQYELLLLPENLIWAWRKVRRAYRGTDALFNHAELAAFELCLEEELESIKSAFEMGTYKLSPIKLVPQPKRPRTDQLPRLRQFFQVSVRDQVAWTAVVNAIGPQLDTIMPSWSYGNRLYRAAWYEESFPAPDRPSKLNIGPYRHSGGHLYRHFKHSWPLFRRHISLTARRMVNGKLEPDDLDFGEQSALNQSEVASYLSTTYWPTRKAKDSRIFSASFDLKQFYPSIPPQSILASLMAHAKAVQENPNLASLIGRMLDFQIDDTQLFNSVRDAIEPQVDGPSLNGIPTGLFVAGFLANVAMLPIDKRVEEILARERKFAHFRFVDDHQVLAYDFTELTAWISRYASLLEELQIGSQIAPDKYSPSELHLLISPNSDLDVETRIATAERAKAEAIIDGLKPTKLMTKTLALVSTLATADFDLLNDVGRRQRMEQLEWLLLANIPEQEIKGETRAAFAAAKIAHLTPDLFTPNAELLIATRKLRLQETRSPPSRPPNLVEVDSPDKEIAALKGLISSLEKAEAENWEALRSRHFQLLFDAFTSNPEKIRLFTRLIDYCHWTGFDGFPKITAWMEEALEESDIRFPSRCYFGAMALHKLALHVLLASSSIHKTNILHQRINAAFSFLRAVGKIEVDAFVPKQSSSTAHQGFQRDALQAFAAALLLGAEEVGSSHKSLQAKLRLLARRILKGAPNLSIGSLASSTGWPIGVWIHWQFATTGRYQDDSPPHWQKFAQLHDANDVRDWNNLRRYPRVLPPLAWEALKGKISRLSPDDAGWLYDAALWNSSAFAELSRRNKVVAAVRRALTDKSRKTKLVDWVRLLDKKTNDPRHSEWTALEILRQILDALSAIGSNAEFLDYLHPTNITIPRQWSDIPASTLIGGKLSWEGWRRIARRYPVKLSPGGLSDYRYSEILQAQERSWPRRLRSLGQLIWGILRRSFLMPSAWNIRGQERSLIGLVIRDLERLPISSCTLAILQATLLPRSRETSLFDRFPDFFAKLDDVNDTDLDLSIETPTELSTLICSAQELLLRSQMTLLEHEPRQLIPVHLRKITEIVEFADSEDVEALGLEP